MPEFTSKSQAELDNSQEIKNLKKIEATLFISARYLSIKDLVELTDINPLLLSELLQKLRENYHSRDSAVEIIDKNGMWKMDVREEHHRLINKIATGDTEFTKAEQETLAVIAYKQPVKQSVVIKIRGNKAYEHIKHFVEVGMLKAKKLGRTKELNLSEEFYDYFNVGSPKPKENKELEEKEQEEGKEEEKIEEKTKEEEKENETEEAEEILEDGEEKEGEENEKETGDN